TPMNGIIGMTELALDSELTREQREHLEAVRSSADVLLTIINDLLDFSKIDAGKLELQPVPFDLQALMSDVARSLALRAHEKHLELVFSIAVDLPAGLRGDALRLRQVLVNLVSNAIKFTEVGEVVVSVTRRRDKIRFTVSDTGIGIPEERQRDIFEAFTQVDGSTTRRFAGTGLGLTITSRLVEAMGGTINLSSQVGHGTTFVVELPLEAAEDVERVSADPRPSLFATKVMVVDDSEVSRKVLARYLEEWGIASTLMESGIDALAALRGIEQDGRELPVILCDARMPGMDGFSLLERMRAELSSDARVVMMLTTDEQTTGSARARQLGVVDYVIKPVRPGALLRALGAAASGIHDEEAPTSGGRVSRPMRSALKLLVAEDNAINATLLRRLLERQGHDVTVVTDGKAALDIIGQQSFDLALIDMQMPELGGLEVAWLVREEERKRGGYLPMIAVTAHVMKGTRESCLQAGFDAYMSKPVRPEELAEAIDGLVPATYMATPATSGKRSRRRSYVTSDIAAQDSFDRQKLLTYTGHDLDLAREIVGMFLDEYPGWVEKMKQAIEAGQPAELQRVAHMLKGAVSNYGTETTSDLALILERMGRDADMVNAPVALRELEESLSRIQPALNAFQQER
ncbi:MAG: response regulator, partial [Myxococcales bacterium]|nr:response regulator [Myxococcales bacterium]